MTAYRVAQLEDIDEITDGREPWRPVRLHFGITSFGVNTWTARNAGDRIINEHDEEGEDEELYVVQSGRARFELDGESVDAPAGTFVFVEPGVRRTAFAEEAGTTLLAVGGTPGKAYEPSGWELWAEVRPLYEAKQYDEAADRASALVDAHPEYPMMVYNLACIESLAGRKDAAIGHLGQALERSERMREFAARDSDFDAIRDEPEFQRLVANE
jgi:mannose-6-phosphate isomerase-like protein (cupin superfamily)